MFLPQETIRKKRDGHTLTSQELELFFSGVLSGQVTEYQAAAMLMAIYFQGMSSGEVARFTEIMRDSGSRFDWGPETPMVADKHSTGGVGDKTSLIVLPLAVLEGVRVPMISGRGLGHTGGTLDKLESIGINVFLQEDDAVDMLKKFGGFFIGQTKNICPLDRMLYSLRDVTATVESFPLICGSILSKKLAEGLGALVLDVKYGSGAFIADKAESKKLAELLVNVGKECGVKVTALQTSMNSPLGDYSGNALEVYECIEILSGRGPVSTRDLSIELAAHMVQMTKHEESLDAIKSRMQMNLTNGKALEVFRNICVAQGADQKYFDTPDMLLQSRNKKPVLAKKSGWVNKIDVRQLGIAVIELGGGRRITTDSIDHSVGLSQTAHVGAELSEGDPLCYVHYNDEKDFEIVESIISKSYEIGASSEVDPLVAEVIR